ncbi:hypothetical protein [Rhodococcus qingshengii]|uniref:hypothetical protein n=1 Tax=Rhodococcus qingshengii TaxID=334542 RepID=UPI0021B14AE6|nr:hypothetical protein [Rhodococcus qingshengii]MCT6733636.1 hypothetical protein [Rhodococcus qingshengii]MDJ0434221.1 hypothetical protein [Rhodococcus qingshengii]
MGEVSPTVNRSPFRRFLTAAVISSAGSSATAVAMHTWGAHLVYSPTRSGLDRFMLGPAEHVGQILPAAHRTARRDSNTHH